MYQKMNSSNSQVGLIYTLKKILKSKLTSINMILNTLFISNMNYKYFFNIQKDLTST